VIVLVVLGVALVVFGGLVLLKFPDRPGGRIGWRGFEVSSVGAGFPLIAIGVAVAVLGALRTSTTQTPTQSANAPSSPPSVLGSGAGPSCFGQYLADIPPNRVAKVESGALDKPIVPAGERQDGRLGIEFMEDRQPLGAMRVDFIATDMIFRVESIVDVHCQAITTYQNITRPGAPPAIVENHDILRVSWGKKNYDVRLGANSDITVRFTLGPSP